MTDAQTAVKVIHATEANSDNPNDLAQQYQKYHNKPVPNRYKNDAVWVQKRIDEARLDERDSKKKAEKEETRKYIELKPEGDKVHVIIEGQYTRTYSKEAHGPNYSQLADQFANKMRVQMLGSRHGIII